MIFLNIKACKHSMPNQSYANLSTTVNYVIWFSGVLFSVLYVLSTPLIKLLRPYLTNMQTAMIINQRLNETAKEQNNNQIPQKKQQQGWYTKNIEGDALVSLSSIIGGNAGVNARVSFTHTGNY